MAKHLINKERDRVYKKPENVSLRKLKADREKFSDRGQLFITGAFTELFDKRDGLIISKRKFSDRGQLLKNVPRSLNSGAFTELFANLVFTVRYEKSKKVFLDID